MRDPLAPAVLVVMVVRDELADAFIAVELDRLSEGKEEEFLLEDLSPSLT
jgi:hypothetical protein